MPGPRHRHRVRRRARHSRDDEVPRAREARVHDVRETRVRGAGVTPDASDAVGIGDPQIYAGKAGTPKFKVGDAVTVRELPVIFYTRTPEYVRGATGTIAA